MKFSIKTNCTDNNLITIANLILAKSNIIQSLSDPLALSIWLYGASFDDKTLSIKYVKEHFSQPYLDEKSYDISLKNAIYVLKEKNLLSCFED
jgi:hypothetical protein